MTNKLVVGNWKMNGNIELVDRFIELFATKNIIIGFPNIFIAYIRSKSKDFKIAAQDCSIFDGYGSYTGEISAKMLANSGVQYVILGHSERRSLSELDSVHNVFRKLSNSVTAGLTAICCVDENFGSLLDNKTETLIKNNPEKILIALEPLSAIGTGSPLSADEISRSISAIKRQYNGVRILYGGSVTSHNFNNIICIPEVDGILIGGASLQIQEIQNIVCNLNH
ncbi:MAG: triose-phosphate isomerase [Holosporales bacterium]|jgi:triosephosphate isomerase|nr:triose-phosphate isomerase [Holosporales bacterium]